MYIFKAKKNLDARDFDDYRRRLVDREDKCKLPTVRLGLGGEEGLSVGPGTSTDSHSDTRRGMATAAGAASPAQFPSQELPDGVVSPYQGHHVKRGIESETTTTRPVEVCWNRMLNCRCQSLTPGPWPCLPVFHSRFRLTTALRVTVILGRHICLRYSNIVLIRLMFDIYST